MDPGTSGTRWLVFSMLAGLIALSVLALGAYSIWHTTNNLRIHERIIDRRKQELQQLMAQLHLPENAAKAEQLTQMIDHDRRRLGYYEEYRDQAYLIAGSCLIPGLLGLAFFAVFVSKRGNT